MKKMLIAILLGALASTIASAATEQDDLVKRVGKYAASPDKPTPKATCVCQGGENESGYLVQRTVQLPNGLFEVRVDCLVMQFDGNGNHVGALPQIGRGSLAADQLAELPFGLAHIV